MSWPKNPTIYEINTWVWLQELSEQNQCQLTLNTVSAEEWDRLASLGADAVWLMGVWERSPAGTQISRTLPVLLAEYERALPDYSLEDVVGSPYCIHRYVVDRHLGGPGGLAVARDNLARRGLRLLLDYVPNHVAPDHPWILEHSEYFIQGNNEHLSLHPSEFFETGGHVLACGRDPYFPPWTDTAQLNVFNPQLRRAAASTLCGIARQCDGVRCDMAMLLINRIFERTWGLRAGTLPAAEYWQAVISEVRLQFPEFLFIAETYWDLEWELQQQGFDYCYDKRLYDRLIHDSADSVRLLLLADLAYQGRLVRFIENHDEPRASQTFAPAQLLTAAVTVATLPGARLFHDGQFEGYRVKLPVQLGRRPVEPVEHQLQSFYSRLLEVVRSPALREGEWALCERSGWPDNTTHSNLVAWSWHHSEECFLVVVNLSNSSAQGRVHLPWNALAGRTWHLTDLFSGEVYLRSGNELRDPGLYVGLEPWGFHFLRFES